MAPTTDVARLYRSFMRVSKSIQDYNLSAYFVRRTRYGFRHPNPDPDVAIKNAVDELSVLRRCVTLANLYPSTDSVMQHPTPKTP